MATSKPTPSLLTVASGPVPAGTGLPAGVELVRAAGPGEVLVALAERPASVLFLDERREPGSAARLLREALELDLGGPWLAVVSAAGAGLERFAPALDADRLAFLSAGVLAPSELEPLLVGAFAALRDRLETPVEPRTPAFARLELHRHLAGLREPWELAAALERAAIVQLEGTDTTPRLTARCRFHDRSSDTLWLPHAEPALAVRDAAAVGLLAWCLRARCPLRLPRLDGDPRFDPEADHPGGSPQDRFLAVPLLALTERGERRAVGVLAAYRGASAPPFSGTEAARLGELARIAAPVVALQLETWAERERPAARGPFRLGALREQQASGPERPEPLRLIPTWLPWAVRALVAGLLVTLLAAALTLGGQP